MSVLDLRLLVFELENSSKAIHSNLIIGGQDLVVCVLKEEIVDGFKLIPVKEDRTRTLSPGCWTTRMRDERASRPRKAARDLGGTPVGQCVKAIARCLPEK